MNARIVTVTALLLSFGLLACDEESGDGGDTTETGNRSNDPSVDEDEQAPMLDVPPESKNSNKPSQEKQPSEPDKTPEAPEPEVPDDTRDTETGDGDGSSAGEESGSESESSDEPGDCVDAETDCPEADECMEAYCNDSQHCAERPLTDDKDEVEWSSWTTCEYANTCSESGLKQRTRSWCDDGERQTDTESRKCERKTDGQVLETSDWGRCSYSSTCDESAKQSRTIRRCEGGAEVSKSESKSCRRNTDGKVLDEGEWAECTYGDTCSELGTRSRTQSVCADGDATDELVEEACVRDTDGTVTVDWSEWTACDYEDACDESAEQTRTRQVCVAGVATEETGQQSCERDTDGNVVEDWSEWGLCSYTSTCGESGLKQRTRKVCESGASKSESESDGCERDTDGVVAQDWTPTGECSYTDACSETGTRDRERKVCSEGSESTETDNSVDASCDRDTDGKEVGTWERYTACVPVEPSSCAGFAGWRRYVCDGGSSSKVIEQRLCRMPRPECEN